MNENTTLKGQIEAILFLTGRPLQAAEIAEKLIQPVEEIEVALLDLISDYSFREDTALEIDDTDGYILQVKDDYDEVVNRMVPVELSMAAIRTLSAIALHEPILQSTLIESRGANAYEHIKELLRNKLVTRSRKDRSYVLRVTPKFHEYFKLTGDKEEIKHILGRRIAQGEFLPDPPVADLDPVAVGEDF